MPASSHKSFGAQLLIALSHRWGTRVTRPPQNPLPEPHRARRLFATLLRLRPAQKLLLTVTGIAYGALGLGVPLIQKQALEGLMAQDIQHAAWLFVVGFLVFLAARVVYLIIYMLSQREAIVTETWLSQGLYQQALLVQPEHQGKKTTGEIVSLVSSHLTLISFFLTDLFPAVFTALIPLLMAPAVLYLGFGLNPWPLMISLLVSLALTWLMAKRTSHLYQRYKVFDDQRLGAINEWIGHAKALRALNWLEAYEARLAGQITDAMKKRQTVVTMANVMSSFAGAAPLGFNIVALGSIVYLNRSTITTSDALGLLWVVTIFLVVPMRTLPWVFVLYYDAQTSIQRIAEFLHLPRLESLAGKEAAPVTSGNPPTGLPLHVANLNYNIGDQAILAGIDLQIAAGSVVAIVGDVGAGKSALLHSLGADTAATVGQLQLGPHTRVEGAINAAQTKIRPLVGVVPQEAFMFPGLISENLQFSYQMAPLAAPERDQMLTALDLAAFTPDLAGLPLGLESPLGERGINLSGGQRQRLEIARLHLADKPVVLLDDPFSALDKTTADELLDKLILGAWHGKTRILVTHRLSVLPRVDQIIYLVQGRVRGVGDLAALSQLPDFAQFVASLNQPPPAPSMAGSRS